MIIYEFKEGQGLGNQLWCFFALYNISLKLKREFRYIDIHKFKGRNFINLGVEEFNGNKDTLYVVSEVEFYDKANKYYGSIFDSNLISLIETYPEVNFLVEGLFQSEKYFFNNDIRKQIILKFNNDLPYQIDFNTTCILNIRGGEYKKYPKFNLSKKYWLDTIALVQKEYGVSNFKIITDDPRYTRRLLPSIETLDSDIESGFQVLLKAKVLILSNSSFSYFPTKLAENFDQKVIIAPAFFARPYNKNNTWCSPCNYYENWNYYDTRRDLLLTRQEADLYIMNTLLNYYKSYPTRTYHRKTNPFYVIKKVLKYLFYPVLKKLFPLKF